MTTDKYDVFFERVPCYVSIIDRDFRLIRANEKFRQAFGVVEGRFCYEAYKHRHEPCANCPAALTFKDGAQHVSTQAGFREDGSPAHYVVTTSPFSRAEGGIDYVIEMATDITPVRRLEEELKQTHDFYKSLVRNSATGILAVDTRGKARIINPAARELLGWKARRPPTVQELRKMLPEPFTSAERMNGHGLDLPEVLVRSADGQQIPARFSQIGLKSHGKRLGRAIFLDDLRETKRLEQEKLEAERLGAVGQTVAGLAHTIKNLLMGLEGGMYMVNTGLRKGDAERITEGWEILQRNFEKTTSLVKSFLSFAKGQAPALQATAPDDVARGVVNLYRETAARQGVELVLETADDVRVAPLDPEGIETCLTNLVSNGIDAAIMREHGGGRVVLRTRDDGPDLVFEVADNGCGMDQEVKTRVFTTFFTTKGGKGTGLGLLTTRKIVQEHGGRIEIESSTREGTTFRIRLPRKRLQSLADSAKEAQSQVTP